MKLARAVTRLLWPFEAICRECTPAELRAECRRLKRQPFPKSSKNFGFQDWATYGAFQSATWLPIRGAKEKGKEGAVCIAFDSTRISAPAPSSRSKRTAQFKFSACSTSFKSWLEMDGLLLVSVGHIACAHTDSRQLVSWSAVRIPALIRPQSFRASLDSSKEATFVTAISRITPTIE